MAEVPPGTKFGPYEVIDLIGTGGMGEVYRVRDPRMRREVALKIIRGDAITSDRLRRFEQEARTSAALNHPNIITVHDVGDADGVPYLVCELLQGETLRERLRRGAIPPEKAIAIGVQIARGLTAAHDRGIVHRDLKPENLFLTRDGVAKLMDFGIAKLRPNAEDDDAQRTTMAMTEAGAVVGTAAYMSPEQVASKPVDHRSDIFSFGAILYELLCGSRPFSGATSAETMTAIMRESPAPLSTQIPNLPVALDRVVAHCLEKDSAHRFQSARDVLFALESLSGISDTGTTPRVAADAPSKTGAIGWQRWWMLPIAAVLGAALVYVLLAPRQTSDAPTFARIVRVASTDAAENTPVLSPDHKWIAYIAEAKGRADVYVRFVSGGEPINLTAALTDLFVGRSGEIGGLDISPDGSQIAFQAGARGGIPLSQSTYVIPAPLGGSVRKLIDRAAGLRWSPDGKRIVYARPGGSSGDSLVVADASGDNAREILPVSGGLHAHWPAWSADGKYIYFTQSIVPGNAEPSQTYRVPAIGGPLERVIATSRRAAYAFPSLDGRGIVYSANPEGAELALYWQSFKGGQPVRITTGVGEYAQARLSADGHAMVAVVYQLRRALESIVVGTSVTESTRTPVGSGANGDLDPSISPLANRIAFTSARSGGRNIWTSAIDGSDARQITSGPDIDERPTWSPDGSQLAFVSGRGGVRGVWTISVDGAAAHHVTDAQVLDVLTWSPDGREIVFAAPDGDVPHLFRVATTGGTPQRVSTPGPAVAPNWSAKRNLIAYIETRRITGPAGALTHLVVISPDGKQIADFQMQIPTLSNGNVVWSSDGKYVAAYADPGGALGVLWLVDVDHAVARKLVELPPDQRFRGVAWAPASDRLIFGIQTQLSDLVLFDQGR